MTTLVGVQGKDFVVFAADSQITDNDQRIISIQTPKIIHVGKYLLGVTGDSRPGDIMAYNWSPPAYKPTYHPVDFMGKRTIPSIYSAFKDNGYEVDAKETNFSYLLSFNAYLFSIGGDLSFNASEMGLFPAGSGGNYALGYLYPLQAKSYNKLLTPKVVAEKAIKIASILDVNTCPPIQLEVQMRG